MKLFLSAIKFLVFIGDNQYKNTYCIWKFYDEDILICFINIEN